MSKMKDEEGHTPPCAMNVENEMLESPPCAMDVENERREVLRIDHVSLWLILFFYKWYVYHSTEYD